jgi:AcrR family transcriptional regulator
MMSVIDNVSVNRAERRRHHTREQLKQAAIEAIFEHGYANLTIRAITERADLGYGTFYLYFAEKDDIVWDIMLDMAGAEATRINGLLADVPFPRREYLSWIELFRFANTNRDSFISMLGTNGSNILVQRYQNWLAQIHESNLRAGTYSAALDVPVDFLAQFVAGALMRLMVWWLETPNSYTPEDMADMTYQTVYREPAPGNSS